MPKIISRRGRQPPPEVDLELDLPEINHEIIIVTAAGEDEGLPTFEYFIDHQPASGSQSAMSDCDAPTSDTIVPINGQPL